MVKFIDDPEIVVNNKNMTLMLIKSWGVSSDELKYLPVYEEIYKEMEGATRGGAGADVYLQNYNLRKTLGIGSFCKVKIATHKLTGHKVAIKILNRRKRKNMEMEEKGIGHFHYSKLPLHKLIFVNWTFV